jgi:hypothetical protein
VLVAVWRRIGQERFEGVSKFARFGFRQLKRNVAQLPTADGVIDFHLRSVPAGLGQCSGMTTERGVTEAA